uniref:Uncharacterized protein n=1 Tax=Zea mays TaxID=4577 RepID=B6SMD6_MAIZE|nr:hypothetical protein [Zea mays]
MTSLADSSSPLLLSINGDSRALSSLLPTQAPHLSSSPLHCSTPSFVAVRRSSPLVAGARGVRRSVPFVAGVHRSRVLAVRSRAPLSVDPSPSHARTREADCAVDDPNSFEDDPQDPLEQEGDAGDFDGDFIDDDDF